MQRRGRIDRARRGAPRRRRRARSSSRASAASRSVSWPRMWATPRSRTGPSASAPRAATTGVSSPTSCRSRSTPCSGPVPRTVSPSLVEADLRRPSASSSRGRAVAGLGRRARPVPHGHLAAGHQRRGEERRGVGEVGLDGHVQGCAPARARPPSGRARCRRPGRPRSRSAATVMRGGARTARAGRRGARRRPCSNRAPASSSAETNWLEAEASSRTSPPATRPVPWTVNGSAPRPSSSTSTPSCAGRRSWPPSAACARGGHRRSAPCRRAQARPPAGRSASPCRPGRTSTEPPVRQSAGRHVPVGTVEPDAARPGLAGRRPSARCRASAARCAPATDRRPAAARTSARLVSDFDPGTLTWARTGDDGVGAGQRSGSIGHILGLRALQARPQ